MLECGPQRLITGHFAPIEGADRIAEEVTALRDAMRAVHDRTAELMNSGADLYTAMREVRVPERFDIGEGYGKTSWNVRAIWEMYTGWFRHRSTTELYGVPPDSVAADVVDAAGAETLDEAARAHLDAGQPVQALRPPTSSWPPNCRTPGRVRSPPTPTRCCWPAPKTSGRKPGSPNRSAN